MEKMPHRFNMFNGWDVDLFFTVVSGIILIIETSILSIGVSVVTLLVMLPKLKREIENNHGGSMRNYIKYMFSKCKRKNGK